MVCELNLVKTKRDKTCLAQLVFNRRAFLIVSTYVLCLINQQLFYISHVVYLNEKKIDFKREEKKKNR